jgi:hypothetical protein
MNKENTDNQQFEDISHLREESKYEYVFKVKRKSGKTEYISVMFDVDEQVLKKGYRITHPVDLACDEPDVTRLDIHIDYEEVYLSSDDDDYDSYTLTEHEEKKIIQIIEEYFTT